MGYGWCFSAHAVRVRASMCSFVSCCPFSTTHMPSDLLTRSFSFPLSYHIAHRVRALGVPLALDLCVLSVYCLIRSQCVLVYVYTYNLRNGQRKKGMEKCICVRLFRFIFPFLFRSLCFRNTCLTAANIARINRTHIYVCNIVKFVVRSEKRGMEWNWRNGDSWVHRHTSTHMVGPSPFIVPHTHSIDSLIRSLYDIRVCIHVYIYIVSPLLSLSFALCECVCVLRVYNEIRWLCFVITENT